MKKGLKEKLCCRYCLFTTAFLICLTFSASVYGIASFPGAEGFGSHTPGGRGGRVIYVTNLNASGPGSFRAACNTTGPRIIVFNTGGTIALTSNITIKNPYITIAGQTAPGDGICLKGAGLVIETHDVIVRGLRIRVGDNAQGHNPDDRDGLGIQNYSNPPYNIIIDHCSISWAIDGNLDLWYPCHDITIQYCLISEALHNSLHSKGAHSTALLVGEHAKKISIHHCLMAHCNGRNPLMKSDTETEVINNVVYNWGTWNCTDIGNYENLNFAVRANIISNVYKPLERVSPPIRIDSKTRAGSKIYVKSNIGPGRPTNNGDDWLLVSGSSQHRVDTFAFPPSGITVQPVTEVFEAVLNNVGAIVPHRDTVDRRAVQTTLYSFGRIIDSQDEVGGWPNYASGTPPTDSDFDGMPDAWEVSHGLDPTDAMDGNAMDLSPEGYTNIEVFLNGFFEDSTRVNIADGVNVDSREAHVLKTPLHCAVIGGDPAIVKLLLAKGADVNAKGGWRHETPLHYAAMRGNVEIVELLLAKGANVNIKDSWPGDTPLHYAARSGTVGMDIIELLIANGADVNDKNNDGQMPVDIAVSQNRNEVAKLLIEKGADVSMHLAAYMGDLAKVKSLIEKGVNVNAKDEKEKTPLSYAAQAGKMEAVQLLIKAGAVLNCKDKDGQTPVNHAMAKDHKDVVELLISKGADVSLHVAAYLGDLAKVRSFIEKGADVNAKDEKKNTPLCYADKMEVVRLLVEEGADINAGSWPPLCMAVDKNNTVVAEYLIAHGAVVNAPEGWTALQEASEAPYASVEMVELLISKGADVNAGPWTALHGAVYKGRRDIAEVLLDKGADVNAKDEDSRTPLWYAKQKGHTEIVELLRKHGAKE